MSKEIKFVLTIIMALVALFVGGLVPAFLAILIGMVDSLIDQQKITNALLVEVLIELNPDLEECEGD